MDRYIVVRPGDKVRATCRRSGRCCSTGPNVALTAYDVCRIARYMGVDWRSLKGRYIVAIIADVYAVPALRGLGDGVCVFLRRENGLPTCSIYPARPLRCRLYPFQPAGPSKQVLYLDTYCPGVGHGPEKEPPWRLYKHYQWELRRHYQRLHQLVFNEGYEPLEALEKLIDEVCREAEENPDWVKPEYLDTLS